MALIGSKPLVWHIMKLYSDYGLTDFILCIRDDDEEISKYFSENHQNWRIKLLKTGNSSSTGERLFQARSLLTGETFMVTYGDGVANVNITNLVEFHYQSSKIATVTAVRPKNQYGILKINSDREVVRFTEKPKLRDWINGGFFVFNKKVFDLMHAGSGPLEHHLLNTLVEQNQLCAFKHAGYWKSVDTYKDYLELQNDYRSKVF